MTQWLTATATAATAFVGHQFARVHNSKQFHTLYAIMIRGSLTASSYPKRDDALGASSSTFQTE